MTINVRKWYDKGITSALQLDPFDVDSEKQPIEPGPTQDRPYKFTQYGQNPQASGSTGQFQRDPAPRSNYGTAWNPGGIFSDLMWQGIAPMERAEYANVEDPSQYSHLPGYDEIYNPNSLQGHIELANLPGYDGPIQETSIFDIEAMVENLGITSTELGYLMEPEREQVDVFYEPTIEPRDNQVIDPGGWQNETHYTQEAQDKIDAIFDKLSDDQQDELYVYLGLSQLTHTDPYDPDAYHKLDMDLDDEEHIEWLWKMGRASLYGGTDDASPGVDRFNAYDVANNQKDLYDREDFLDDRLDNATADKEWETWVRNTTEIAMITAASGIAGAASGPFAPVVTPAVYSYLNQTFREGRDWDDIDLMTMGRDVVLGAAMGYTLQGLGDAYNAYQAGQAGSTAGSNSGITGLTDLPSGGSSGYTPGASIGSTITGGDLGKLGVSSVLNGATQGYTETQEYLNYLDEVQDENEANRMGKIADIQKYDRMRNELFGYDSTDPFYQPYSDTGTEQQGIV